MGVTTTYDEMKEDYALDLYVAIKRVKDMI